MATISDPEIERWLILSYEHITTEDVNTCRSGKEMDSWIVGVDSYRFFFKFRVDIDDEPGLEQTLLAAKEDGLSDYFMNIINTAYDMGCQGLCFDEDGQTYQELPTTQE